MQSNSPVSEDRKIATFPVRCRHFRLMETNGEIAHIGAGHFILSIPAYYEDNDLFQMDILYQPGRTMRCLARIASFRDCHASLYHFNYAIDLLYFAEDERRIWDNVLASQPRMEEDVLCSPGAT
jgi:hypothetical protein